MVEFPSINPEIEKLFETEHLIDRIFRRIADTDFQPGPGVEAETELQPPTLKTEECFVFYGNRFVANADLQDALERPLTKLYFEGQQGILVFVDPAPSANWAHACWIGSIDVDCQNNIQLIWNNYPPLETAQQRLVRYPYATSHLERNTKLTRG